MNTPDHRSSRKGLAIVDNSPPSLSRGPTTTQRIWAFLTGWFRDRRRAEKEILETNRRLKTLLDTAEDIRKVIQIEGKRIAASEQRAQVRLQNLQANHETLRDTLNLQADAIEKLQNPEN